MVSPVDKIPWHSGLLLILLPSFLSAHLFRLGDEESPIPNGSHLPYSESLSIVCPPEHEWLINGSRQLESQDSSLSFVSAPQEPLKLECLSSIQGMATSNKMISYSFLYILPINNDADNGETLPRGPPVLKPSFEPRTVLHSGENLSLSCLSETKDNQFLWLRNGKDIQETGNTLSLSNISSSGIYGCLLISSNGSPLAYTETQVLLHPKITHPPQKESVVYVLRGSSFQENCSSNSPSLTPEWITNDEESIFSSELSLPSITQDTLLSCRVQSEFGEDSVQIQVLVVESSKSPPPQSHPISPLESTTLSCEGVEFDPRLEKKDFTYNWYTNGTLSEVQRGNTLQGRFEAGNYTCVITTPVDAPAIEYNVFIVSPPVIDSEFPDTLQILRKDPFPSVECTATGDPEPSLSWTWIFKDGIEEKVSSSGMLTLNSSLAVDSSVFKCNAENIHGAAERNFTLRAFEPTIVINNASIVSVNASGQVNLKCGTTVDPYLESSITWLKDNDEIQHLVTSDHQEVFIPYLHLDHGGTYSCIVKTPLETVYTIQELKVIVEPPVVKLPTQILKVTEGSSILIHCNASGIPAPSIHWKNKDAKVSDDDSLSFEHIGFQDSDSYSCLAVNEYGSQQESLTIEVYNKTQVYLDKETLISETSDLVVLECPVHLDNRLKIRSITWYKDGLPESISNETKLIIRNATKKDQGTYICRVETPVDDVNQTLRLTILSEGPSFLSTEEDIRTLEGSNVTVTCQANGLPIPKVTWTKNGVQVQKDDGHRDVSPLGDLSIYHVSLNDQGNYTCTASNIYGSISTHSTIEVIQRSKMATDFKKVKNVIKNVRENVVLDCDVVYDSRLDREIELLWKKDDIPIRINRSKYIAADNSLKIYNLDISDDGTYECQVNTPFESISSKTALIVSGEPPKIVSEFKKVMLYEGEDLRLECLVRGVPRPTLIWYFQDAPLTNAYVHEIATASKVFRESRVILKNITKANDGVYQCRADNDYGSGVAKFSRVNVLSRTKTTISESGEISVHAGTNLKIPCSIQKDQMNQITNIQWVKPFKVGAKDRVDFGIDGSLSIQDVQKRHSGEYKCLVTTILDKANSSVNVIVNVNAPFISSFTGENQFIFQGESLSLFCNGNGIPKPTISWNFNKTQTKVVNDAEFKILNAIASDSGNYECVAKNQYGETRKNMFLRVVQVPPLEEEIAVDEGEPADLSCIVPNGNIKIQWRGPNEQNISDYHLESGTLTIQNVNLNNVGEYSCIISLESGRSRVLKRSLRIKPEIIMSRNNTVVEILEGKNLTLECNVLPGIGAKRLWKHNENIIIPGGNREVSNRGGLLTIENIRRDVDSGKYVCIAIADFGKDTIEYTVSVDSKPVSIKEVSCTESHSNPIFLSRIVRVGNDSVLIRWEYPSLFNTSCYESMFLSWWTSEEDSSFSEIPVSFSQEESRLLKGLSETLRYFVQMNLRETGTSNKIVGETRSFYLSDLQIEELSVSDTREMPSDAFSLLSAPAIIILVLTLLTILLLLGAVSYLYSKRKLVCCGHHFGQDKKMRKRTNIYNPDFRDFQLIQSPARGIDDFMQNLAPQWPEPEPPAKLGMDEVDETAAFIKPNALQQGNNNAVPSGSSNHPHHHRSQNNSISSSWSSLFNMPIDPATMRMNANNKSNKFSGFVT